MTAPPGQPHLFVDDATIARREGVRRRVHGGAKLAEPVISGPEAWESDGADARAYVYGTVLPEPTVGYRMWYMRNPSRLLHAVSRDGLNWRGSTLGLVALEGGRDTNAPPVEFHSPSVIRDAIDPDPARRYKMLGHGKAQGRRGYWAAFSGDGLHWQLYDRNPVLAGSDTCTLSQDPVSGEYLAFHKLYREHRGRVRRLVYLSTSPDMQTWSEPVLAMAPDEEDDESTRARGGICSEFYNMSAFPYGGQWLGLVTHFRLTRELDETGPDQSPHDGPIEAELVHSRDGRTWQRCEDRSPAIANGPHEYDAGCILGVANQPVIAGDEMWMYYAAINTTHGGTMPPKEATVARAAWPLDRWVSLDAGAAGGVVEVEPVTLRGGCLTVNADAADGEVRVEVTDEAGAPLPGYEGAACQPIRGDELRHEVRWKANFAVETRGPVGLRFHMRRASLFSWSEQKTVTD